MSKTVPGFRLIIEDNTPAVETVEAVKDVMLIYGILPETLKYTDDDGNVFDKYIEPNKPMLITSREEAIKTLDISNMVLTREIRNIIQLCPNDATIALCKIVKRNGESPDPEDMIEMYEALDFAFEMTENYPIKQPILAGVSLDKSLANEPGAKTVAVKPESSDIFDRVSILKMIGEFKNKEDAEEVTKNLNNRLSIEVKRDSNSANQKYGKGVFSDLIFKLDGEPAFCIIDGEEKELSFKVEAEYNDTGDDLTVQVNKLTGPLKAVGNKVAIAGQQMIFTIAENVKIKIDQEYTLELLPGTIQLEELGHAPVGEENVQEFIIKVGKNSAECNILQRTLRHVDTITRTKNPAMLFMSPEPARNSSSKAIQEYVDRAKELVLRAWEVTTTVEGKMSRDLGMYLTVPVGVNRIDGIGGLYGFPQSTIATVEGNKIVTAKPTTVFEPGDNVEVYTYNKLDIITLKAKVLSVSTSKTKTTEIVLDKEIPSEIKNSKVPKYIMNTNDKDENGNYLSVEWANVVNQVGTKRSASGITWNGECQVSFSAKQLDEMNGYKLSVLDQTTGTTQGTVSKSQLLTKESSQFQDIETMVTVYALVSGSKAVGQKYVGQRIDDASGLAIIKTELESTVFDPAVGEYITSGYELKLFTKKVKASEGNRSEKALFINFTVTEIETLKALVITARIR